MSSDEKMMIGTCKFCGQQMQVENAVNQDDADEMASLRCECFQGKEWRDERKREEKIRKMILSAEQIAYEMIGQDDSIQHVLEAIIVGVARRYIDQANVAVNDTVKIQIKTSGIEGISLQKTTTVKEQEEV